MCNKTPAVDIHVLYIKEDNIHTAWTPYVTTPNLCFPSFMPVDWLLLFHHSTWWTGEQQDTLRIYLMVSEKVSITKVPQNTTSASMSCGNLLSYSRIAQQSLKLMLQWNLYITHIASVLYHRSGFNCEYLLIVNCEFVRFAINRFANVNVHVYYTTVRYRVVYHNYYPARMRKG